jgi:hypothetical protein
MRLVVVLATALTLSLPGVAPPAALHAQVAGARFPAWEGQLPPSTGGIRQAVAADQRAPVARAERSATRGHTGTGVLIGGLVGVAATTVFLVAFCGDPDTACGADEVGRAVVLIAVPCAAVGALIGSLVRTEE